MPKKAGSIKVIFQVCPLSSKEKQNGWKIGTIVHKNEGVIGISNSRGEASKTFHFWCHFLSEKFFAASYLQRLHSASGEVHSRGLQRHCVHLSADGIREDAHHGRRYLRNVAPQSHSECVWTHLWSHCPEWLKRQDTLCRHHALKYITRKSSTNVWRCTRLGNYFSERPHQCRCQEHLWIW